MYSLTAEMVTHLEYMFLLELTQADILGGGAAGVIMKYRPPSYHLLQTQQRRARLRSRIATGRHSRRRRWRQLFYKIK